MKEFFCISIFTFMIASCGGSTASNSIRNTSASSNSTSPNSNTVTAAKVTIDSPDGVKIIGTYLPPTKPNSPALLLLHQWQSDRHSYDEFAKKLQDRGFAVLSIDGRGFGESTKKADGSTVTAGRSDADVKAMLGDVDAAFKYLSEKKGVDSKRVGIVGASYGSSLALLYAADHPEVAAAALLSPGLNYFGNMPTRPAVEKFDDRNLILFAAKDDKESADAVGELNPILVDNPKYPEHVFESGGHGTALLKVGAAEEMSDFFASVFDLANLHLKN